MLRGSQHHTTAGLNRSRLSLDIQTQGFNIFKEEIPFCFENLELKSTDQCRRVQKLPERRSGWADLCTLHYLLGPSEGTFQLSLLDSETEKPFLGILILAQEEEIKPQFNSSVLPLRFPGLHQFFFFKQPKSKECFYPLKGDSHPWCW